MNIVSMKRTRGQWMLAALLAPMVVLGAGAAVAADLVVVEARGVNLTAGQTVDGAKPLALEAGQRVTLISADGKTIRLRGPYNGAPAPAGVAEGSGVVDSLKSLVAQKQAGTATLGVVRSGAAEKELPEPWLVNVSKAGNRCIVEKEQVVFWRPEASAEQTPFVISPSDRSWQASSKWPAASDRMGIPATMPLRDGQSFEFEIAGQSTTLTFHVIPAALNKDQVRAAWMMEKGCEEQAAALVKVMK